MGVFLYEARNRAGELFAGTIEAKDKREAAGIIRRRGLWIASLSPQEEKKAGGPAWRMQFTKLNAMSAAKLRVLFLRQMAAMMQAGMPVHQALEILSRSDGNPPYQSFLQDLLKGIMAGHPLHEMLAQHPQLFSASLCGLVRAGEASGSLTQIFAQLADFEEHRYEAREALKSALLILLVVAVVSLVLMTVFVLPAFAAMLQDLRAELPWTTKLLLTLMAFVESHLALLVAGIVLAAAALFALLRHEKSRTVIDGILLKLPILGPLQCYAAWRILLELLSVMLANGILLTTALEMARDVPANLQVRLEMRALQQQVEAGQPFAVSLRQRTSCPGLFVELLMAGETTGTLDAMMGKAAAFAAADVRHRSARGEALAEPIMIFFVGGLIFFFVLSIVLPLLTTMDALM